MLIDNLKRVSEKFVGAVDDSTPYLCKHSGGEPLSEVLNGKAKNWYWNSISIDEAENMDPIVIMFVKHIVIDHHSNAVLTVFKKALKGLVTNKDGRIQTAVSITGLLIDTTLFLKDKYKSEKLDLMNTTTHDNISVTRTNLKMNVSDRYLTGRFDLKFCTYYCKW